MAKNIFTCQLNLLILKYLNNYHANMSVLFLLIIYNYISRFKMNTITRCPQLLDMKQQLIQKYDNTKINVKELLKKVQVPEITSGKKKLEISEQQFIQLIRLAKKQLSTQPSLLRLSSPIAIATGTAGYYTELADIFGKRGKPQFVSYLMLGDYTGKGNQPIQCLVALCAYKIIMPTNFFLLRGCFQTIGMARSYNLHQKLTQKYSKRAWLQVCQLFTHMPFAATIDQKIFCVHSGLSPQLQSLQQIARIPKPILAPNQDLSSDLLWADPDYKTRGWSESSKGTGFSYGQDVVQNFCQKHCYFIICRGHEIVRQGWSFSFHRKLVSICSVPNYDGMYSNDGAIMSVDDQSNIFFQLIGEKKTFENKDELRKEEKIGSNFIVYK